MWKHSHLFTITYYLKIPNVKIEKSEKRIVKSEKVKIPNALAFGIFSCYPDSDRGPHPYQGCALPTEPYQLISNERYYSRKPPVCQAYFNIFYLHFHYF